MNRLTQGDHSHRSLRIVHPVDSVIFVFIGAGPSIHHWQTAGPLALPVFYCDPNPALQAGLGKLSGRWPWTAISAFDVPCSAFDIPAKRLNLLCQIADFQDRGGRRWPIWTAGGGTGSASARLWAGFRHPGRRPIRLHYPTRPKGYPFSCYFVQPGRRPNHLPSPASGAVRPRRAGYGIPR